MAIRYMKPIPCIFGIPRTPITRITNLPAGAKVTVIQNPEDFVRAIVEVGWLRETWIVADGDRPGEGVLSLLQGVEFVKGGFAHSILELYCLPFKAAWKLAFPLRWFVGIIVRDLKEYQDELDKLCSR